MDTELAAINLTDTAPSRQYKLVQVCATDQGVNVLELNSSIQHSTASAGYAPMVFSIRTHQRVCGSTVTRIFIPVAYNGQINVITGRNSKPIAEVAAHQSGRSEERRVGKEC